MKFYFSEFLSAVNSGLTKAASYENIFDMQGSMFPNIDSQHKWKMARTPTHMHLHDGQTIYNFRMPHGFKNSEDFPLIKEEDVPSHRFGEGSYMKASMQVHRADPGSIYFTVQDGQHNQTFTLKHTSGSQWRAMPKNKDIPDEKPVEIDQEEFIKGAMAKLAEHGLIENVMDGGLKGADWLGRHVAHGIMSTGQSPYVPSHFLGNNPVSEGVSGVLNKVPSWAAAGTGALLGGAYDLGKRTFYNTQEENDQESFGDRAKRYALPAAGLGLLGAANANVFPNYYNSGGAFDPLNNG